MAVTKTYIEPVVIKISGQNATTLEKYRTHPRDTWNDLLNMALSDFKKKGK